MPWPRPTLTQLQQQSQQDILGAGIPGISVFLRFGILQALTWAQAGLAYLHYGYLDYIAKQAVPWTATDVFLAAWGALKGVFRKGPQAATGPLLFTAGPGTSIPAGTQINRSDGTAYTATAAASASNGAITVTVVAVAGGAAGNCAVGTGFALSSPIEGIGSSGVASAPIISGADQETDDALRGRVLAAYASVGGAGTASDYEQWALDVPGVTRAWCVPRGQGPGTVIVYVMLDNANAAESGFPQGTNGVAAAEPRDVAATGDQLTVANAIMPIEPVDALVYVCAPVADPIPFAITGLGTGNTAANQAAIGAALADMFVRLGDATGATVIQPNQWEESLAAISGLTQFTVASPTSAISTPVGSLPTLGAVTFAS